MAKDKFAKNPGMLLVISYVVLAITNAVVIMLANTLFPQNIVLGTVNITYYWAVMLSMGKLTLIDTFIIPFVRQYEIKTGSMFSNLQWTILYFFLNFASLWLISRFSHIYGLGISSWVVVALLALVFDMAQGAAMMALEKYRK